MMRKLTAILIIIIAAALNGYGSEFEPSLNARAGIAYPTTLTGQLADIDKAMGLAAGATAGFSANTDLLPKLWFVPAVNFDYTSTAKALETDDSRFLFSEWMDIYLNYGIDYEVSDYTDLRLRVFNRFDYAKQTDDEEHGKGLYDYVDSGFYVELAGDKEVFGERMHSTVNLKYTDKKFPNYSTLIAMVDPATFGYISPDFYAKEKDNISYSAFMVNDLQWGSSGWYTTLEFSYNYIKYLEQRIINSSGMYTGGKRVDKYVNFDITFPYYFSKTSGMSISYGFEKKMAGQAFYETFNDLDRSNNKYMPGYYDYLTHKLKLSLNYEFDLRLISAYKPVIDFSLNYEKVGYDTRRARNSSGAYETDKQEENNYILDINYSQNITEFWHYYLDAAYSRFMSNTTYTLGGAYNYALMTISMGTGINF